MSGRGVWKLAVRKAIGAAGGIEAVAAALGYSKSTVGRWNNLNDSDLPDRNVRLQLDELAMANGGQAEILQAQARLLGHVAFCLPEGFGDAERVTLQLSAATARFGAIASAVVEALADGAIDSREEGTITNRIDEALIALGQLRALVAEDEARLPGVRAASGSAAVGRFGMAAGRKD